MKYLILFIIAACLMVGCNITRITIYGNGNIVDAPCHIHSENICYNYEGVEIHVQGSVCDYKDFLASQHDRNVLLSRGYRMHTDYHVVYFTHPKYY